MSRLPGMLDRGGWRAGEILAVLALIGAGVAATWDAWSDILWIATRDEEQSHVLLVPVVAAWLVWMRRGRLRNCPRDKRWVGPVVVAAPWKRSQESRLASSKLGRSAPTPRTSR